MLVFAISGEEEVDQATHLDDSALPWIELVDVEG